jgi:hypothetical protein
VEVSPAKESQLENSYVVSHGLRTFKSWNPLNHGTHQPIWKIRPTQLGTFQNSFTEDVPALLNSSIQMVSLSPSTYKTKVNTFGLGKMSMSGFTRRKVQVRGVLGLKALQVVTAQEDEGSTRTWSDNGF